MANLLTSPAANQIVARLNKSEPEEQVRILVFDAQRNLQSNLGYFCFLHTWDNWHIIQITRMWCANSTTRWLYIHFYRYFLKKDLLLAPGFEPMTFWLASSCQGIAFLIGIWISVIDHLSPIRSQYSEVTKTTTVVTGNTVLNRMGVRLVHLQPWATRTTFSFWLFAYGYYS